MLGFFLPLKIVDLAYFQEWIKSINVLKMFLKALSLRLPYS